MMLGMSDIGVLSFRVLALRLTKSYKNLASFYLSCFLIINMLQAAKSCAGYIRPVSSSALILSLSWGKNSSLGRMRLGRICQCLSLSIRSIVWLIFLRGGNSVGFFSGNTSGYSLIGSYPNCLTASS